MIETTQDTTKHEESATDRVLRMARELTEAQRAAHHETMTRREALRRQAEAEDAARKAAEPPLPPFPAPVAALLERDEVTLRELGPAAHLDPEIRDELAGIARRRRVWQRWQIRKQVEETQRIATEHEAANAPKPLTTSATMSAPDDVLVVSGNLLANGGVTFTAADGVKHLVRVPGLVSFLPRNHPAVAAIEAKRAERIDYQRRSTFGAVAADEGRWRVEADERVGFTVEGDEAADVLRVALRWTGRTFLAGDTDQDFRSFVAGCGCARARVRWLDVAERQGRTLTPLAEWADRSREAVDDARSFWSEAGDLETRND